MITPTESEDNKILRSAIVERIRAEGAITFADFMEMALYYPDEGYYTNRAGLIGARGDFYTAPHLTAFFGELIARQLLEMWQRLEKPAIFSVVEMGAGQGLLAGDILSYLYRKEPEIWAALDYHIIEISETLRQGQIRRLMSIPDGAELLEKVSWNSWADFSSGSVTGVFLSNELVDAFPVHLVEIRQGKLFEIYVKLDEAGNFVEEAGSLSTPALAEYFERSGLTLRDYENGYRTEVNLQALDWMGQVASALKQGYVLTIDYGFETASRYHPRRASGTLQCYYQHRVHPNPYLNIGRQDITAHVDFSALEKEGEAQGLTTLGLVAQAVFLGGLGIAEMLVNLSLPGYAQAHNLSPNELLQQREALQRLVNPNGMGNFKVLVQGKGVSGETPLQGLSLQF